jgi:hypothetical protein
VNGLRNDVLQVITNNRLCEDAPPPPPPNQDKCNTRIMIILDDTGSVRTEWEQQRDFVAKVVGTPSEQSFTNGLS